MLSAQRISFYCSVLTQELQVAMGCTEPIAVAYAAAYGKKILGKPPERCVAHCSGNIIKNVKAVTVPQTGGLKSIETAILAGIHGGDANRKLEVLSTLTDVDRAAIRHDLDLGLVSVELLETDHNLHIIVELFAGEDSVSVEIVDNHTNLGFVRKNNTILHHPSPLQATVSSVQHADMTLDEILDFAHAVDLNLVRAVLDRQIQYNSEIAQEGLTSDWGAQVGKTLLATGGDSLFTRMKATAAAGSDARMSGCAFPVVINSGSGNQGMTVSLPVICYAKEKGFSHDDLLRALCAANLTAIYQKSSIGRLSAFCGVVSAAIGAMVGIALLDNASYAVIAQSINNSLANISGMVCDGAKASCASKIASAIESALLGYALAQKDCGFTSGEGIVGESVDITISNIGRMASQGMVSTDKEILQIMIGH